MKKFMLVLLFTSFAFMSCETEEVLVEPENQDLFSSQLSKDEKGCETAFAYYKEGSFCDDNDLKSNRWGWYIGPLFEGTNDTYEIYAGAGKCDINKGELVGTLDVNYGEDGNLSVNYNAFDGYGFFETHLYVGDEKYPRKRNGEYTVAPGQYGNSNSFPDGSSSDSFEFEDLSGGIYIIAHAVVCDFEEEKCEVDAGSLIPDSEKVCIKSEEDTNISATSVGDALVPDGFEVLYVLTIGDDFTLVDVSDTPSFVVNEATRYRIHTLVYDPNTLDLSGVDFGVTTAADILAIIGEYELCAALDAEGVRIYVEKCAS